MAGFLPITGIDVLTERREKNISRQIVFSRAIGGDI